MQDVSLVSMRPLVMLLDGGPATFLAQTKVPDYDHHERFLVQVKSLARTERTSTFMKQTVWKYCHITEKH